MSKSICKKLNKKKKQTKFKVKFNVNKFFVSSRFCIMNEEELDGSEEIERKRASSSKFSVKYDDNEGNVADNSSNV